MVEGFCHSQKSKKLWQRECTSQVCSEVDPDTNSRVTAGLVCANIPRGHINFKQMMSIGHYGSF